MNGSVISDESGKDSLASGSEGERRERRNPTFGEVYHLFLLELKRGLAEGEQWALGAAADYEFTEKTVTDSLIGGVGGNRNQPENSHLNIG